MQPDPSEYPELSAQATAYKSGLPYRTASAFVQPEGRAQRVIGFLIDLIPAFFIGFLNFIPIVGWMAHGFLSACYWLFRDITGSSLGKMAMGSVVVREDGGPAGTGQKILRNLPLAIPGIVGMVPFAGIFFELILGFAVIVTEVVLLLATGRRLGDRIAGTTVIRK